MFSPSSPHQALLRGCAGQVLAGAAALPSLPGPITLTASDGHIVLTLTLSPARLPGPAGGQDLTPCEWDVLAVLAEAEHRLTTSQLLGRLERSGRLHGERTVTRALARLRKLGLVCSSRQTPRGYYLPDKPYPVLIDPDRP